ncbi:MAG: hypothetical protein IAG10_11520 [Planctomycetaceae bacterium]|nr:hypothetical protein [Planctomycetaceae bacterium]
MDDSPPPLTTSLRLRLLLSLCLVSLGFAAQQLGAAEGETVRLAYKFQPNESLHLEYKQDMKMSLRVPGLNRVMSSQTIADKHLRVISVDTEGNALVEPVIDRTRMTSRQDEDAESKFDSDDGEDCPAEYRPLLATVGKPLVRIKFAPNGKLLQADSVHGGAAIAKDIEQDPTLNFLIVFPEQPISVGEIWKDEFETTVQLDKTLKQGVKIRREYRLLKLNGSRAEIELKTVCLTPLRDPKLEMQISSRLLNGTIVFDHHLGQIVSREMRVENQVINGIGPNTMVSTVMTQSERSVPKPNRAKRDK